MKPSLPLILGTATAFAVLPVGAASASDATLRATVVTQSKAYLPDADAFAKAARNIDPANPAPVTTTANKVITDLATYSQALQGQDASTAVGREAKRELLASIRAETKSLSLLNGGLVAIQAGHQADGKATVKLSLMLIVRSDKEAARGFKALRVTLKQSSE